MARFSPFWVLLLPELGEDLVVVGLGRAHVVVKQLRVAEFKLNSFKITGIITCVSLKAN